LALFGRRPLQRVVSLVIPATKNLHTSGRANTEAAFFVAEGPPLPMNSLGEHRRRVLGKSGIDLG
jgi:hypothetical protein